MTPVRQHHRSTQGYRHLLLDHRHQQRFRNPRLPP